MAIPDAASSGSSYETHTLISARLCTRCGCYVAGLSTGEHDAYHAVIDELRHAGKRERGVV